MKILLVGEYSRLHNSLKEGLITLGHTVKIIGDGDGFKNFPVDIKFENSFKKGIPLALKRIIYKIFKIDLGSLSTLHQFNKHKNNLTGFDVVQIINERAFKTLPNIEIKILEFLFKNNKNVFLLSCGTDYLSVKYAFDKKYRYSILTPYFNNKVSKKEIHYIFQYLEGSHINLHTYIYQHIKGVIASDMDYHLPIRKQPKYLGLIPNPINTQKIDFTANLVIDKIVIFHGINSHKYYKKGNDLFDEALQIISSRHKDKVEIISTTDIPYDDYINSYNKAHILLDMVYAYDQGYNALEAMAKGKVVFTGAEQEWLDYYGLEKNTVAINAEPLVDSIVENLEWLINNPEQIIAISKNAREFIEKEHNYIKVANRYLEVWNTSN